MYIFPIYLNLPKPKLIFFGSKKTNSGLIEEQKHAIECWTAPSFPSKKLIKLIPKKLLEIEKEREVGLGGKHHLRKSEDRKGHISRSLGGDCPVSGTNALVNCAL